MPTIIRNKIFEINSSSTHSITFTKGSGPATANISELAVHIGDYKFGWGVENYTDSNSLFAYILIYLRDWCDNRDDLDLGLHNLQTVLSEVTGNGDPIVYYTRDNVEYRLHEYFEKILDCTDTNKWSNPLFDGYIDHQSVEGNQLHYIIHDKEALLAYLFGDCELITGNDNDY